MTWEVFSIMTEFSHFLLKNQLIFRYWMSNFSRGCFTKNISGRKRRGVEGVYNRGFTFEGGGVNNRRGLVLQQSKVYPQKPLGSLEERL